MILGNAQGKSLSVADRRVAAPRLTRQWRGANGLEGCCSIHLSYGRDVTAEELNARRRLVYGDRSDPGRLSLPSHSTAPAPQISATTIRGPHERSHPSPSPDIRFPLYPSAR